MTDCSTPPAGDDDAAQTPPDRVSRRTMLLSASAAGFVAGAVGAGVGTRALLARSEAAKDADAETEADHRALSRHTAAQYVGQVHQPGIANHPRAHTSLAVLTLHPDVTRDAVTTLLKRWTEDAERLMTGKSPLGDPEPELVSADHHVTVTVGFGPGLFEVPGLESSKPEWFKPLPVFPGDELRAEYTGGDLMVQVCGDDAIAVDHAIRLFLMPIDSVASVLSVQRGFQSTAGESKLPRNLFGQVDGTANPDMTDAAQANAVWRNEPLDPEWLAGGTMMVVRRFGMDMPGWARTARPMREEIIGRDLKTGAPLTGGGTFDTPDFEARADHGGFKIATDAHVRLAHSRLASDRILRRAYNFQEGSDPDDIETCGLLFISFQADVDAQFTPLQQRLAERDMLNEWITALGSSVFLIPRGVAEGEVVGGSLFSV